MFPKKITSRLTSRGERIVFYQDLYKEYSRREFTRWVDRPIAVSGLERRLIRDLKAQGGFGAFDDGSSLLQRTLLWRRGQAVKALRRITFPPERNPTVPSWSWMAYEGGIDYLEMPFDGVDWQKEVHSPWLPNAAEAYHTADRNGNTALSAIARTFEVRETQADESLIVHDNPNAVTEGVMVVCVVMGRRKADPRPEDARNYVLFVAPKNESKAVYERVGVGFMPGSFIEQSTLGLNSIKIR